MFKLLNSKSEISTVDVIVRTDYLKRTLLPAEGLMWTDLLVLCALKQLEKDYDFIYTSDVIAHLGMNKCWIYRSLRKLRAKGYINTTEQSQAGVSSP